MPEKQTDGENAKVGFYYRSLDFSDPSSIQISENTNIPGRLFAVDGTALFTQDYFWNETHRLETSLRRLERIKGVVQLEATRPFLDRSIETIRWYGSPLFVTNRIREDVNLRNHGSKVGDFDTSVKLTLLARKDLTELSESALGNDAQFLGLTNNRVIFNTTDGIIVINAENPKEPYTQSFFPTQSWYRRFKINGDLVVVSSGLFGLNQFDIHRFNLLQSNP